jgi:hypothetical protein
MLTCEEKLDEILSKIALIPTSTTTVDFGTLKADVTAIKTDIEKIKTISNDLYKNILGKEKL